MLHFRFAGTGHVGVGSIVDMSNSQVAALVGADVVLVANGGLGSAFDDLELNRALLERHGVKVRGVIINKVMPEKEAMMRDYFGRLLEGRWGVPLLGVVPNLPLLAKPTLGDIEGVPRRLQPWACICGCHPMCPRLQLHVAEAVHLLNCT